MTDLQQYRHEIDRIDNEIVRLFEERMEVCEKVARYKIQTGKQVLDPEREKVKIDAVKAKAHTSFNAMGTGELFKLIMAISRKRPVSYTHLCQMALCAKRRGAEYFSVPGRGGCYV